MIPAEIVKIRVASAIGVDLEDDAIARRAATASDAIQGGARDNQIAAWTRAARERDGTKDVNVSESLRCDTACQHQAKTGD